MSFVMLRVTNITEQTFEAVSDSDLEEQYAAPLTVEHKGCDIYTLFLPIKVYCSIGDFVRPTSHSPYLFCFSVSCSYL